MSEEYWEGKDFEYVTFDIHDVGRVPYMNVRIHEVFGAWITFTAFDEGDTKISTTYRIKGKIVEYGHRNKDAINLCDMCSGEFATCTAEKVFDDMSYTRDNVISCNGGL